MQPDRQDRRQTHEVKTVTTQKIVDMKLPLTWLLGAAASVAMMAAAGIWQTASLNNKLDLLIAQQGKLEARFDERDNRIDAIRRDIYEIRRLDDTQSLRIESLERFQRGIK